MKKTYRVSVRNIRGEYEGQREILWERWTSRRKAQEWCDEFNRISGNPSAIVLVEVDGHIVM